MKRALATLLLAVAWAGPAPAAEITVLSAGAVEPGLRAYADVVRKETGDDLAIQFSTAPRIAQRLAAGEAYHILVSPPAVIAQAAKDGKVDAATRVAVGRVGVGVTVRSDAPVPAIGTVDALKATLLAADSIVYNTASTGLYLEKLFDTLGIKDALQAKTTRYPDGAAVMEHVLRGKGSEIGFGAITEIRLYDGRGLRLVGPLPAAIQNYTSYEAVLMTGATASVPARAALAIMATPAGRAAFASGGVE
jgi:molybdate transport system substrate-binding protein